MNELSSSGMKELTTQEIEQVSGGNHLLVLLTAVPAVDLMRDFGMGLHAEFTSRANRSGR